MISIFEQNIILSTVRADPPTVEYFEWKCNLGVIWPYYTSISSKYVTPPQICLSSKFSYLLFTNLLTHITKTRTANGCKSTTLVPRLVRHWLLLFFGFSKNSEKNLPIPRWKIWKQLSSTLASLLNIVLNYYIFLLLLLLNESKWKFIYLFIY